MTMPLIGRIVCGGQTGADRAALDWAIENKIPHGGWCPKGRRAEDGRISVRYHLNETTSKHYIQRTEWNVQDSDGTVVFSIGATLTGNSRKTVEFAMKHIKPVIHISSKTENPAEALLKFIRVNGIKILNVAGPRASMEPEISNFVKRVLCTCQILQLHETKTYT
jgi:Circularly permutated YpsA SLOG family